jgi:hypothetical protein
MTGGGISFVMRYVGEVCGLAAQAAELACACA